MLGWMSGHGSWHSLWCPLRITWDLIILSMTSNRLNTGNMITSNNFNLIRSSVISTPVWVLTFGVTSVTTQLPSWQARDRGWPLTNQCPGVFCILGAASVISCLRAIIWRMRLQISFLDQNWDLPRDLRWLVLRREQKFLIAKLCPPKIGSDPV